ncbi:hypothetical protein GCM10020000_84810 [Streptomyces olivoverticillatus]
MRAVRILYHSRTSRGRDVAASGVVVLPAGRAPRGGWRVLADAHGTSGLARGCAPSLMKDIRYGDYLRQMVRAGFAVVATDFTGLGADGGPFEYLNKRAEAADVLNALPAARATLGELGSRWVAVGHSVGGHGALGVAEMVRERAAQGRPERGYLGTVAVAPVSHLTRMFRELRGQGDYAGLLPMITQGGRPTAPPGRTRPPSWPRPPRPACPSWARAACRWSTKRMRTCWAPACCGRAEPG